jgi:type VI secretion system protein ImpL
MRKTWALAVLGLAAFAASIWFAGPLLVVGGQAPLGSSEARGIVIAIFTLQYLAQKVWGARRARRTNEQVVSALTPAALSGGSPEDAQLRERFANALAELRNARLSGRRPWQFGRSYLYQLPWYAIIGAPGTGKTTALLNSGLSFPLAEKLGRGAVRGFGGTRNCDWWFTDRAVLLDTAGRYTTHESDPVADRQAWGTFLQLLLRTRPRCPLNGILVAVSVADLLDLNAEQVDEHARLLRARLDELQNTLRVRMPVYVLLTKCDLLPGFLDWFGTLERKEREQMWGVTFDPRLSASGEAAAGFGESFDRLSARLADRLVERLQAERDMQRRARLFSLPSQLRALREPLAALVRGVGGRTLLRGVYLTSGTQGGTPIDRMLAAFGRELGLERQILPSNYNTGRSFFLAGLLNDIVFAETELGGWRSPGRLWRRRILGVSIVALLFIAAVLAIWWIAGYARSTREIAQLDRDVSRVRGVLASLPAATDADPRPLLRALNATRNLARAQVQPSTPTDLIDITTPARRKLASAAHESYDRLLLGPFQARIAHAIDTTMRTGANVSVQYEALKTYRMLSDPRHFDADGLRVFVTSYWDSALTPSLQPSERRDLLGHVDALLRAGAMGSGIRLEPALVESVRNRLISQPSTERINLRLGARLDESAYADFTVASLGAGASGLFVGSDGKSEPLRVPGHYTLAAYERVVADVPALASQLASESRWVLDISQASSAGDVADVLATYRATYAQAWTRMLDELRLKPAATTREATEQARALGAADGPLARLLRETVRQTPLRVRGGDGPISAVDPAANRFAALAALVERNDKGSAPLDVVLSAFRDLPKRPATAEAQRQPEPIRSMLVSLGERIIRDDPASISKRVAAQLGVPCIRLVADSFPFDRRATRDASFADFARVFGPKGAFDHVFTQTFAARVDTSSEDWRWKGKGAAPARDLERFRAAARIRDVFFARGGTRPTLRLTFRPLDLDEAVDRFTLEIDGQTVRYAHGPPLPTVIEWPGPQGEARIALTPAAAGGPIEYTGPWALLRLFDQAAVQSAGAPGRFRVIFNVGGHKASFEVETDVRANPFRLRELEHFDCPLGNP